MRRGQTRAAPGHTAAAIVRTVVMLETDKLRILHITTHNYTRGEIRSIIVWCGDQTVSSVTRVNTTPPHHTQNTSEDSYQSRSNTLSWKRISVQS